MADCAAVQNLLVVIMDTNPFWWGQRLYKSDESSQLILSTCISNVMAFCNAHLILNQNNKLAVIAAHLNESRFLYPKPGVALTRTAELSANDANDLQHQSENAIAPGDGKYEVLRNMNDTVAEKLKDMILQTELNECFCDTVTAGSLTMALCYIHRLERQLAFGEKLNARILVVKGADDNPSQYMNFMNAVFTAQKQNILIDACILADSASGLLQQAADITGAIYLQIPQLSALLQYMLWAFLPDADARAMFALPPRKQVDYRAACFCHRNLIDIGYVCSVCLSIFCAFSPICSTCHTTFKIVGPKKFAKKKKRSSAAASAIIS
ncbi:general transcription factor IIH subunit 3-like [Tubulanus polymorphus]|uniref:general transcription factor IIH subunit 3-like n=1 Tax=Tubulanus polymorphus TaxID=672921 RepID=UPI003DA24406